METGKEKLIKLAEESILSHLVRLYPSLGDRLHDGWDFGSICSFCDDLVRETYGLQISPIMRDEQRRIADEIAGHAIKNLTNNGLVLQQVGRSSGKQTWRYRTPVEIARWKLEQKRQ